MSDTIVIPIPEWAKDRNFYFMVGVELAAYRLRGGPLMVKTSRCNMCGECCNDVGGTNDFPPTTNGRCNLLTRQPGKVPKFGCGLNTMRPHMCCVSMPDKKKYPHCTEEFEEI